MATPVDIDVLAPAEPTPASVVSVRPTAAGSRPRPLRVAHLLGGREGGGITTAIAALLGGFPAAEVTPSVVILRRGPSAADSRLEPFAPHYLGKTRGKLGTAFRLSRWCRRQQIDILHTHSISSNFYGRLAGLLSRRTQVVTTVHANTADELRGTFGNAWLESFVCRADLHMHRGSVQLIAVSEWLKRELIGRGVSSERVQTVSHGIPPRDRSVTSEDVARLRSSLQIPRASQVIAIVGRLTAVKNHDLLFEAAIHVSREFPGMVLLVIGDGARRTELEQCAKRLLPPDTARFVGWVDDVVPYLHLSDVLVSCSRSEGFGYTVLEAMACGTPVVATDVAALPEIVRHTETGLLVPPGDASALANAISQLLHEPGHRTRMGQAGRADVTSRFSLEQEVAGTLGVYRRLQKDGD